MKNAWKGLIVGGLTGAGFGTLLDLLAKGSDGVAAAGDQARRYAPVATARVKEAVAAGAAHVEEAGIPERIADAAHRAAGSDLAGQAKGAVGKTVHKGKDLVGSLHDSDVAGNVKRGVAKATAKGQQAAEAARR